MHIIDIGACVGSFIDDCIIKYSNKELKIYAFEPHPKNFNYLKDKYANNGNIILSNFAISNFNGQAKLFKKNTDTDTNQKINDGSSLCKEKNNINIDNYFNIKVKSILEILKIYKLKKNHIDILKIDSEGAEYEILNDIIDKNIISNFNNIYFEDHSRKIKNLYIQRNIFFEKLLKFEIRQNFYIQYKSTYRRINKYDSIINQNRGLTSDELLKFLVK